MSTEAEPNEATESEQPVGPTYAPAAMAMGITMFAWGLLTSWMMTVAGACLIGWALVRWILDVANTWRA